MHSDMHATNYPTFFLCHHRVLANVATYLRISLCKCVGLLDRVFMYGIQDGRESLLAVVSISGLVIDLLLDHWVWKHHVNQFCKIAHIQISITLRTCNEHTYDVWWLDHPRALKPKVGIRLFEILFDMCSFCALCWRQLITGGLRQNLAGNA